MESEVQKYLVQATLKILKPLVKILLKNKVSFGTFMDLAKKVYVDVANNNEANLEKKQTNTNISILTGLSRKEVLRVRRLKYDEISEAGRNRVLRVISGWMRDKDFLDSHGAPRTLQENVGDKTFYDLVKEYSGDISAYAILDEMKKNGVVKILKNGKIKLVTPGFIPVLGDKEKIRILGQDVAGLISTIDFNLNEKNESKFYQRKVYYDNLPPDVIEKFQVLANQKSQELLELLNIWLAKQERQENTDVKGIGLGIYYFEQKD